MKPASDHSGQHAASKKADLASGFGAGILGAGLGALLGQYVGPVGVPLVILGIGLHAWGMFENHRLESGAARVWWADALYWFCWIVLVLIGAVILVSLDFPWPVSSPGS